MLLQERAKAQFEISSLAKRLFHTTYLIVKRSDHFYIYKLKNDLFVKLKQIGTLTLKITIYLSNRNDNEKQTVGFYLDLNDKKDTAVFVKKVTQLWNCVNVKTKHGWVLPNEKKGNHSAI